MLIDQSNLKKMYYLEQDFPENLPIITGGHTFKDGGGENCFSYTRVIMNSRANIT